MATGHLCARVGQRGRERSNLNNAALSGEGGVEGLSPHALQQVFCIRNIAVANVITSAITIYACVAALG